MPQSRTRGSQQAETQARTVELTAGPPKQSGESPATRSHHKPRAAWFRARTAWPLRDAAASTLIRQRGLARRRVPAAAVQAKWELAGPTNIGGRCTALVCDPANADRIWVGVGGRRRLGRARTGVVTWKESWRANTPLEIGSLAIDPIEPGELCTAVPARRTSPPIPMRGRHLSVDQQRQDLAGMGVVEREAGTPSNRRDRGRPLRQQPRARRRHRLRKGRARQRLRRAVRDQRRRHHVAPHDVHLATRTTGATASSSIQLVRGTAFATFTGPGTKSGIYRSTNGGTNWAQLTNGLPATERIGRTTLALAPSNPDSIWAIVADASNARRDHVLGVFRSHESRHIVDQRRRPSLRR